MERPQRGKDIVIEATDDIRLFGNLIECRSNRGLTVYVECKWTSSPSLSFERIASNAAQNRDDKCDAFVVVTNSFFTAGAIWNLCDLFRLTDTRLIVIDGTRLPEIIKDPEVAATIGIKSPDVRPQNVLNGVLVREGLNARQMGSVEITLSLQNQTDEMRSGRLFLQSDAEWFLDENEGDLLVHLPPFGVQAFRLHATRQIPDRTTSLRIGLDLNGALRSLTREYPGLGRLDFRPIFVGPRHEETVAKLVSSLEALEAGKSAGLLVATVFAPAGTGKSRTIQELEARLKGVNFRWLKHDFPERTSRIGIEALVQRAVANGFPLVNPKDLHDASSLIRSFVDHTAGSGSQIPVLVLEDVHNADSETCSVLIDIVTQPPLRKNPLVLILTGRSDHSHGNADFQRLADLVSDLPCTSNFLHVSLDRFDSQVARLFIEGIIRDVPPQVVDALERLSGCVPAHIIQCVEWLLDMSIVRVVHRGAVGIIDHRRFIANIESLPPTMVALLADRYDLLSDAADGEVAQLLLLEAALLGSDVPETLFSAAGDRLEATARELLIDRRFLEPAENSDRLRWHHENLLLHFRNWLFGEVHLGGAHSFLRSNKESWSSWADCGTKAAKVAAEQVRARPDLLSGMDQLSLGRLAAIAEQYEAATELWREMFDDLRQVPGYSTVDIPTAYYEHLRFAYETVLRLGKEPELLPKILNAMTYIGGYSLSLQAGSAAADYGISRASRIPLPADARLHLRFWLRSLKAQFLMDAGLVRWSQGLLLELQVELEATRILREDHRVRYEIYNCLAQLYGCLNHAELALRCFDIADFHANQLEDGRLIAKQLGDRSILYQFCDFAKWAQLVTDAQRLNLSSGTIRHQRHADAAMLSLQFHLLRHDEAELRRIGRELDAIQKDCETASYFSLMPRVYLLRAGIFYALATGNLTSSKHDEGLLNTAEQCANHGLGIGIERGIGYASWQLRNLKAMIALRRGNYVSAREHLQAAFEIMRKDGLLFLGNADLACPNQIVLANYMKLLQSMSSDQDLKNILREIRTYEKADWTQDDDYDYAVKTALTNDALLGRFRVGQGLPRDERIGLGLVVWL
jgi:hypothetical protein